MGVNMMNNHRYPEIILPINRFVRQMPPKAKQILALLEGSLLIVLAASVAIYIQ